MASLCHVTWLLSTRFITFLFKSLRKLAGLVCHRKWTVSSWELKWPPALSLVAPGPRSRGAGTSVRAAQGHGIRVAGGVRLRARPGSRSALHLLRLKAGTSSRRFPTDPDGFASLHCNSQLLLVGFETYKPSYKQLLRALPRPSA